MEDAKNAAAPAEACPHVWALLGHKQGDNNQVLALAEALGWPFKELHFRYRTSEMITSLMLRKTTCGLTADTSLRIKPPWPDLIVSAGRRNEPVARWIQAQAPATKIVQIGRPWTHPDKLDLVVTTPQYELPAQANVVNNLLPLHRLSVRKTQAAKQLWAAEIDALPSPRHVLLIGGISGADYLSTERAAVLTQAVSAMAASKGGSLLVTTSARTPREVGKALPNNISVPHHIFLWHQDAKANPYLAYLAYGDEFIVTGDSISMLTEACFTRRPVHIFNLSKHPVLWPALTQAQAHPWRFTALAYGLGRRMTPKRMRRDIAVIHRSLISEGRAVWLGQQWQAHRLPPIDDMSRTVAAVKALFAGEAQ